MGKKTRPQSSIPSPNRQKIFFIVTFVFPLLFFVLLELLLRLFHYGPNLSLFVTEETGNKTLTVMNPDVKSRYFSHINFSPNTSHDYFEMPKPAATYRIFCLGGSTTVGFPFGFTGSFSTLLRQRLQAIFPEKQIETINLGMTATNSFTTLDITRELFTYQPDLIIIYDGHNEFYGALGVASHESLGGKRWLTNFFLRLAHIKTFLLLRNTITNIREYFSDTKPSASSGTMMEQLAKNENIPIGSLPYKECLKNFTDNMRDIVDLAKEHAVPLIISSQVSNLRDLAPFISDNSVSLSRDQRTTYTFEFETAKKLYAAGSYDSAMTVLHHLIRTDSLRADVHYLYAQCLSVTKSFQNALKEYRTARDYDELRFRTSTDFNDILPPLTGQNGIYYTDIEQYFGAHSPDSMIGNNLILEHLHPNLRGYFLMAKAYTRTMREHQLFGSREEWSVQDTVSDSTLWALCSLTKLDEQAAEKRIHALTSSWPFQKNQMIPYHNSGGPLEQIIDHLVNGSTTWEQAHVAATEYYLRSNDLNDCEKEYKTLIDQLPYNVSAYLLLGQLYMKEKRIQEANKTLQRSLGVEPTPFAFRVLGSIALDSNNTVAAKEFFNKAIEMSNEPNDKVQSLYLLAFADYKQNNIPESIDLIERILVIQPSYLPALKLRELLQR